MAVSEFGHAQIAISAILSCVFVVLYFSFYLLSFLTNKDS